MKNNSKIKKQSNNITSFLLHLSILECLFFSGGAYIMNVYLGSNSNALIVYLLTTILLSFSSQTVRIDKKNYFKVIFIVLWVLSTTFLFGQGNHNFTFFKYVAFAIGTFLLLSSTDFDNFRNLILKYLVIISFISILVQIDHDYIGFLPTNIFITEGEIHVYTYMFNTEWGDNRLASIYWEPGQYQIVIYYVLVLFADELTDIKKWKYNLRKFGILFLAILMTQSTTAYVLLMLLLMVTILKSRTLPIFIFPLFLIIGGGIAYELYNSEAVQKKVEQKENDNQRSSYTIRLADNIGCLMVTMEDPLTGYGAGSDELERRLSSVGSITSSNGWLYGSAQLGLPYLFFLLYNIWRNLRRINPQTSTFILFLLLVIAQCNESNICYPYLLMYVFSFAKK